MSKGNRLRFSSEEDEKLIAWVMRNPVLYDHTHKKYHNHTLRDELWGQISAAIKKSVAACKIRWKSLKDVYRKRRKEMRETDKPCKWEHLEALKFLDNVPVAHRSLPPSQKPSDDDSDHPEFVSFGAVEESTDSTADIKLEVQEHQMEASEEEECPPITSNETARPIRDSQQAVQTFFDSMAQTVMGFSPPLAARAKMEVLQVVSKIELEMWDQASSSRF